MLCSSAQLATCAAGILQEAMGRGEYWRLVDGQGRPPGLMGMWPSRAVTFIENHDTGQLRSKAKECLSSHSALIACIMRSVQTKSCDQWLHDLSP